MWLVSLNEMSVIEKCKWILFASLTISKLNLKMFFTLRIWVLDIALSSRIIVKTQPWNDSFWEKRYQKWAKVFIIAMHNCSNWSRNIRFKKKTATFCKLKFNSHLSNYKFIFGFVKKRGEVYFLCFASPESDIRKRIK